MKKVALFSTHCDTKEKEEALLNNIRKVKKLGLDTFVITIIPLSSEIHNEANYVIYSKENPVPSIDEKSIISWRIVKNNIQITSFLPDYGYASLLQLKRLIEFSSALNYDSYFTMIYDIIITPEIEKILIEGRDCSFFKNPNVDSEFGGILTAFNKENARKFASLLTRESYFNRSGFTAEEWMVSANSFMCGKVEEIIAGDSISLHDTLLITNHSPFSDFGLFILKKDNIQLFFYDLVNPIKLTIETNISRSDVFLEDQKIVHVHDRLEDIKYIKITYNGVEADISGHFNTIIRTTINGYNDEIISVS